MCTLKSNAEVIYHKIFKSSNLPQNFQVFQPTFQPRSENLEVDAQIKILVFRSFLEAAGMVWLNSQQENWLLLFFTPTLSYNAPTLVESCGFELILLTT